MGMYTHVQKIYISRIVSLILSPSCRIVVCLLRSFDFLSSFYLALHDLGLNFFPQILIYLTLGGLAYLFHSSFLSLSYLSLLSLLCYLDLSFDQFSPVLTMLFIVAIIGGLTYFDLVHLLSC